MSCYQSLRNLWDGVNHFGVSVGTYVETDCEKWVNRFGNDLRKLGVDEQPIPGVAILTLIRTVEDAEVVPVEVPEIVPEVVKTKPRKFQPPVQEDVIPTEPSEA